MQKQNYKYNLHLSSVRSAECHQNANETHQHIRSFSGIDTCHEGALHCHVETCNFSMSKHIHCNGVYLGDLDSLINDRIHIQKQFIHKMFQYEDLMIEELKRTRKQIIERISVTKLSKYFDRIIEEIQQGGNQIIKGRLIKKLYSQLLMTQNMKDRNISCYIDFYQLKVKKLIAEMIQLRETIFTDFICPKTQKVNFMEELKMCSKILSESLDEDRKLQFIYDSLQNPKGVQLLYRGSENQFSASIFHLKCNNIQDTLTIISTQFGKTIGGYTPCKWNSSQHANFVSDLSNQSFLISLDLLMKFPLKQEQHAIYCCNKWGPRFGGHDIYLADRCHQNFDSYACFPHSYNIKDLYQQNQKTCMAFSGAQDGAMFRVQQYQVFKVFH